MEVRLQQARAAIAQQPAPRFWQPLPPHSPHLAGQHAAMPCVPGMPPHGVHGFLAMPSATTTTICMHFERSSDVRF